MNLKEIFNQKTTEKGDIAFSSTGNTYIDILFMSEYYNKHLDKVPSIGQTYYDKLFAMFIRDGRFGLGRRDLGRKLMDIAKCDVKSIVLAGRWDDVWQIFKNHNRIEFIEALNVIRQEIENGNELAKKWMPRYSSKNLMVARNIAKYWGMNKQQYGKFIKCDTVEQSLSRKEAKNIEFEHVPSLAMFKYAKRFAKGEDTAERYSNYIDDVKNGKKKLNVSTATVYDIFKNRNNIDADVFFSKIEKIQGNWIPIIDTSASMLDDNDSYGKAVSIGHYLSKCSTYMPDYAISFSSKPRLLKLGEKTAEPPYWIRSKYFSTNNSNYSKEIDSLYTGDSTNTDFGAVMDLLKSLDKESAPEYLIVLSDMEFDYGSKTSKDCTMQYFKETGVATKIIWWNLNSRHTTCPETDDYGNIFMSGYSPMLLKYLSAGFNAKDFLDNMLKEYAKKLIESKLIESKDKLA